MGDLFCPFLNRKEEREDGVGKEGRLEEGTGRGGGRERRRGNCNQAGNDKNEFKKKMTQSFQGPQYLLAH